MMMRKTTLLLGMLLLMSTAQAQDFETATEAVKNMAVGWNLGNTLDSNSGDASNMWIEKWTSRTPNDYEKAWGQPVTKPELIKMMKEAGFNAIRVPVTWYPHMEAKLELDGTVWDKENDDIGTQIQAAWMERVHEVVDYVDIQNINNAKNEVKQIISDVKQYLAAKGAPVIFGEWGTSTDKGYDNYRTNMLTFARYFVEQTKANGMGTLYWMGLSDGEHRSVPEFNQADLKDAIIKGYYGEEGYSGIRELDNWTISPFYNSSDNGQIVNGQIVQCYDLQGRQVLNPKKGIYIKNRKKYLSAKTNS